jgi:uncharacterized protein YlxW (UPF0749 family)
MRRRSSQLALTAVGIVLGLLVVAQIQSQSGGSQLAARSAQELTVLVANLNARNDQLRAEVARLQDELSTLQANAARGQSSLDQLRDDLARLRAWSGLDPVAGPGVRIVVSGPLDRRGLDDLLNELRNAGAEAIAVQDVRVVPQTVIGGEPGQLAVDNELLPNPFEVAAVGRSESLVGSLTRPGGIVAQLAATEPQVQITILPVDRLLLPATRRDLAPHHAQPAL